MSNKNRTTMVIMNFMHFGRNCILNYGANEHDFYHYLYQYIREDQLSYLPEVPAEWLKRDWKQVPSSASLKEAISLHCTGVKDWFCEHLFLTLFIAVSECWNWSSPVGTTWIPPSIAHFLAEEWRTEQPFHLLKHMDSIAGIPSWPTLLKLLWTGRPIWWTQSIPEIESHSLLFLAFSMVPGIP